MMKQGLFTFVLSLLLSSAMMAQSEEWNLDFEEWTDTTLRSTSEYFSMVDGHDIETPFTGMPYGWSTSSSQHRTTDALSGQYALVVNKWYFGSNGFVSLGDCNRAYTPCLNEINSRVSQIAGYYKYFPDNNLNAKATWIGFDQNLDTISYHQFTFEDSEEYTYFELPISYLDTSQLRYFQFFISSPDIASQPTICEDGKKYCNFLYLDNIEIGLVSSNSDFNFDDNDVRVYPNPANDFIYIDDPGLIHDLNIYDIYGRRLRFEQSYLSNRIEVGHLIPGQYILMIQSDRHYRAVKFIKQ